jgi:hypothetical protein
MMGVMGRAHGTPGQQSGRKNPQKAILHRKNSMFYSKRHVWTIFRELLVGATLLA